MHCWAQAQDLSGYELFPQVFLLNMRGKNMHMRSMHM